MEKKESKVNYNVKREKDIVTVEVEIEPLTEKLEPVKVMSTDVMRCLQRDYKIEITEIIKPGMATNTGSERWLKGVWVFRRRMPVKEIVITEDDVKNLEVAERLRKLDEEDKLLAKPVKKKSYRRKKKIEEQDPPK